MVANETPETGTVVVAVGAKRDGTWPFGDAARHLDGRTDGLLRRALDLGTPQKHGGTVQLLLPQGTDFERIVLLVLGKEGGKDGDLTARDVAEAGASLASRLAAIGVKRATVAPLDGLDLGGITATDAVALLAEGAHLRAYRFDRYRSGGDEAKEEAKGLERLDFAAPDGARAGLDAVGRLAEAVNMTKDLVSEPANVLYPETFAERTRALEELGVEVEVLPKAKLEELKMGALLAVNQGSVREPYVVVMRWQGGGDEAPLALIGKGVCFDTGGISIKPAAGMQDMKWDMAGAGAVVGAMRAVAGRKARANVVGVIGLVENMPSGTATRPGDVITTMAGKTVEVINTDAEGRLVLADVLWYAQDRFRPKAIIDLATLTGAVIVALGHERAGLFSTDDDLAKSLDAAGESTGEPLWRLPLGPAYDKHIKSQIADMKNTGQGREAGSTAGAVFLQRYVGDTPWAHLDIAGVAWSGSDRPLSGKGATGFGVRLLDRFVRDTCEG
ncbi:MAG: leucyl aminopeptidase [Geminicoccaceae bacterium]|nr:leucyl aminopeptidase [Geminicoccaceae bacterium]